MQTPATTPKALPPWLLDLAATPSSVPEISSSTLSSSTTMSTTTTTTKRTRPTTTTTTTTTTSRTTTSVRTVPNPLHQKTTETPNNEVIEDDQELQILEEIVDHCPPKNSRGLFWNWTKMGEDAIQVCPQGSSGFARWTCGLDGMWSSERPNLGECRSLWLSRLEQRLQGASSLSDLALDLSSATETKTLYGGDLDVVAKILQALAHRLRQELYVMPSQSDKETLVAELLQSVLKTASNLLDSVQQMAWDDLNSRKSATAVTSLMIALEENALLLAETINNEKNLAEATNNIVTSVRIMRARGVYDQLFPQMEVVEHTDSQLLIPSNALLDTSVNGAVRIVFFLYKNLEAVLPASYRGQFINSKIMGVIASKGRYEKVEGRPVQFTMKHLVPTSSGENSLCAAWDYPSKQWNSAECQVLQSNSTHTTCSCSRLANYAILGLEAGSIGSNPPHGEAIPDSQGAITTANKEGESNSNLALIISLTVVAICLVIFLGLGLVVLRNTDLKPKIDKFIQSKKACFHCKKSESTTSSGSGLYPALTSSPTSTTVSAGTPTVQSSNYLVQILEQQAETMKQVRHQNGQGGNNTNNGGSIYQVTAPRNTFRPVSPYGHHIYMEIDPVYQQHLINSAHAAEIAAQQNNAHHHHQHIESEGGQSDIQLSDISDDDLRRFSDGSRRYAEERPLIRAGQPQEPSGQTVARNFRNCMTTQRPNLNGHHVLQQGGVPHHAGLQNGVTLRPVQVSTLSNFNHHSLRGGRGGVGMRGQPQILHHQEGGPLEAPITIALQGGDQFVSLQIDKHHTPQGSGVGHHLNNYAPVHLNH